MRLLLPWRPRGIGARPSGFAIDAGPTPPRRVRRAGRETIEAIFGLRDGARARQWRRALDACRDGGRGQGLDADDDTRGTEGPCGKARPVAAGGAAYARDFRGPNWLDQRQAWRPMPIAIPTVLVVGGGQAGLAIAARLVALWIDTLIVDRAARIATTGASAITRWCCTTRCTSITCRTCRSRRPGRPYIPKDKLAGWFEAYVESLELNFWTGTEFEGGRYDADRGRWTVEPAPRRRHPARDAASARRPWRPA